MKTADLERETAHKAQRLLEEAARKDGERVRAQDEFVSLKTAQLEKLHEERLAEAADQRRALEDEARLREERRQSDFLARQTALAEEHEKRRVELIDAAHREAAAERASLLAQHEQRRRALDEERRAEVEEVDREERARADQLKTLKAGLRDEFLKKEKERDARWSRREDELMRKYEAALDEQRQRLASEAAALRERNDAFRAAADAAKTIDLEKRHAEDLRLAREALSEEFSRERARLAEGVALRSAQVKDLETRLSAAERERKALSETVAALGPEAASLRAALAELERARELDRAKAVEEARTAAASELAKGLEEAEAARTRALDERRAELERALAARSRALEAALAERGRALDDRERRLEEEANRLDERRRGA
jgi:hypothetical protein